MSAEFLRILALSWLFPVVAGSLLAGDFRIGDRVLTVPDGFRVELAAGPGLVERPIVADFDDEGRLYVAESSGSNAPVAEQLEERPHRILRLEDRDGDGVFDHRVEFADRMMFPEGVMWHRGSLYVGAPPHIWRLTDRDGDGVCDEREEWFDGRTLTGCANDIHGPYLGRDGWIYWCKGAFAEQTYERPGRAPLVTRAAHIFRRHPVTGEIEPVMTGGMDNPIDVVFGETGERFFTTTFLQHPGGGRRDGIIHAIYGGVYGKDHGVIDGHPRTGALMPVMAHLGPAAPCGLELYDGDALGPDFRGNLFAAQFNLRKVSRHVLTADGATFRSEDSDFLVGDSVDFHPTDVLEDADGSLLVVDTGGWYKICCPTSQLYKPDVPGAIYRIRADDGRQAVGTDGGDLRGMRIAWDGLSPVELADLVGDRDRPAVARRALDVVAGLEDPAARTMVGELERRLRVKDGTDRATPDDRIASIWALARIDGNDARAAVRIALEDPEEDVRQAAAHVAGLWRDAEAMALLCRLLEPGSPPAVQRSAAEALGRLGNPAAVPSLLAAAGRLHAPEGADRILEHSLVFALIEVGDVDAVAEGLQAGMPMARRAALIALDQCREGGCEDAWLAAGLADAAGTVRDAAWWVIEERSGPAHVAAEAGRAFFRDATAGAEAAGNAIESDAVWSRRLAALSAAPEVRVLLAEALADPHARTGVRLTALRAMESSGVDAWPEEWEASAARVVNSIDDPVAQALLGVLARRPVPASEEALREALWQRVRATGRSPDERVLALAAVVRDGDNVSGEEIGVIADAIERAMRFESRRAALTVVSRAALPEPVQIALAERIPSMAPGDVPPLVAGLARFGSEAAGRRVIEVLASNADTAWISMALLEEAFRGFPEAVRTEVPERLAPQLERPGASDAAQVEALLASLPPGDIRRGQEVFRADKTACLTCHAIGYVGGNLGPDLTRIGTIRSRRDLIEAILYPSASLVRSYEPEVFRLRDGSQRLGIVRGRDATGIELAVGPGTEEHLPLTEIVDQGPAPVSLMPGGMRALLTDGELADLLAFLEACR